MKKLFKRVFAWLFKDEINELSRKIQKNTHPFEINTDDEDEVTFWKNISNWADDLNAQRYAAKRVHSILLSLLDVKKEDAHLFFIAQGQLAEIYKFSNLPKFTIAKLEETIQGLENKPDTASQKSLVEEYGE